MVITRTLCRQVIPHVIAAWLLAFALSVAHTCLADGHHGTVSAANAMAAHHQGDSSFPDDCERFCNDNTPVSGDNAASDQPAPILAGLLLAFGLIGLAPLAGGIPGRRGQTEAVLPSPLAVLRRTQRLAL